MSAIERWVVVARRACPSNGAVQCPSHCSPVQPEKESGFNRIELDSPRMPTYLANGLGRSNTIVIDHSDHELHFLYLFERYFERERFVVVGIQCALLDRCLLLLETFSYESKQKR